MMNGKRTVFYAKMRIKEKRTVFYEEIMMRGRRTVSMRR